MTTAAPPRPYKGLAPFEDSELDAALFFGRERERGVITANLLASPLTVLYGASGVGKSSLLRAGVAHELGKSEEVIVASSWSEDPLAVLDTAAALAAERGELFLILDQLEEFFLYHGGNGGNGAGTAFASRLAELVQHPDLHVNVLLGIREDSLARLDAFKGRLPNVLGNYLRLEHLERREARAAIVEPLKHYQQLAGAGFVIEAALVEAVLDEVSAVQIADGAAPPGRIEAPYLQLVMDRIWEVESAAGSSVLRLETLRELGGAERIVREHLDRALAALTPAQQATAARMFDHLVTPSGAKVAHAVPDLVSYAGVSAAAAHGVIARLEGERILRPVEGGKVEIFHDVLGGSVSAWRRDYEASLELGRARRRSRRLAALAAGSLVALAFVSVVALYALSQRREAQQQAAVAEEALVRAENETQRAEANEADATAARKEAVHEKKKAQASAAEAKDARDDAVASANYADQQRENAEQQTAIAEQNATIAQQNASLAKQKQAAAIEAQKDAESARQEAADNAAEKTKLAAEKDRQADRAKARELIARSGAVVEVDAEHAIQFAYRATQLERSPQAEDALRDALAAFRLEAVLPGGGGPVRAAAVDPDSRYVVTATPRGGVRMFSVHTGRRMRVFEPAVDANVIALSPDDDTLVAGARNGQALLWSVDTGALLRALSHPGPVTAAGVTSDGELLVTGCTDGVVRVWQAASGLLLNAIDVGGAVRSLSLQPGGRLAVVVTRDDKARAIDLVTGNFEANLTRTGGVRVASFSPRGDVVMAGGAQDPEVGAVAAYIWEVNGWKLRDTLREHTSTITDIRFAPDNERVLTTSADSRGLVWSLSTGELLMTLWHQGRLLSGAVNSRSDQWTTASAGGTVALWFGENSFILLTGHGGPVTHVEFSQDGWTLLTASSDGTTRLWRARDPHLGLVANQREATQRAEFSLRGDRLVTVTRNGTLRLFDTKDWLVRTFARVGAVNDIAFAPSGGFVTAGQDGNAKLFRPDGSLQSTLAHGAPIRVVAISADGRRVASGGDDKRVLVFSPSGRLLHHFSQGGSVTSLTFSGPDTLLSGGSDGSLEVWDADSGRHVRSLDRHGDAVRDLAATPGGLLASASDDRTARVYDLRTGELVKSLEGHLKAVNVVAFSPDGRVLLTASTDGEVRTWSRKTWKPDILRGRPTPVGARHVRGINGARFSPDGRWILTAGPSAVGIWQVRTGDLLYFIRGHLNAVRAVTFAPNSWQLLTAGADGTMRNYRCDLCGELPALQRLADARLRLAERGR